jgi:hypothetical protein
MPQEMTWRKAIEKVLSDASGAVHYKDIADKIMQNKLRSTIGATPAATVSYELTTAIRKEGGNCPFQRIGEGLYIWKERMGTDQPTQFQKREPETGEEKEPQYDIITSFGMFWRRDAIDWSLMPKILGMQQIGAEAVDFHKQIGIYLLYDGREVIYVGRATERPLGRRLYEHTLDRFSSRWDRFSWFGLLPVSDKGILEKLPESYEAIKVIPAAEAILIEALEPRQNRKRGDDLSTVEYIQKEDSEIKKKKIKQLLD